jgi:hypothetical protein
VCLCSSFAALTGLFTTGQTFFRHRVLLSGHHPDLYAASLARALQVSFPLYYVSFDSLLGSLATEAASLDRALKVSFASLQGLFCFSTRSVLPLN